jgi:myo-inositol-1(or 4)-monophosphatase
VDGFWEERLQPWDMMAGILMVTEAGGTASRFDGSPLGLSADEIVATNGVLHGPMLEVLRQDAAEKAEASSAGKTR